MLKNFDQFTVAHNLCKAYRLPTPDLTSYHAVEATSLDCFVPFSLLNTMWKEDHVT